MNDFQMYEAGRKEEESKRFGLNSIIRFLNDIPLIVEFKLAIRVSDAGYLHIPLLYFACGSDGFIIDILGIDIQVSWGDAVRKTRTKRKSE